MATAIDNNDLTYVNFPITKWDKTDDGDLIVWGKATDGSIDSDDQIVDTAWSAKALEAWHNNGEGGNVRVQHQAMRDPAGKSLSVEIDKDGDGGHWVKSLIVEPVAKRLVEKGILRAYSVGISRPLIKRDPTGKARGGIVAGGSLAEISLVDRPANKACGLVLGKADKSGDLELVGELFGDQDWLAKVAADPDFLGKADAGPDPDADKPAEEDPEVTKDAAGVGGNIGDDDDSGHEGDDGLGGSDATDHDDTDGEDAVSKASGDQRTLYKSMRKDWQSREPSISGAVGGTEYLQRRADWMRWHAEGEAEGLDGTRQGAELWMSKRDFSAGERRDAASSGAAMKDGSFPIKNGEDLGNAIHLAGHAKNPSAARAHIKRRAAALGMSDRIPDSWKVDQAEAPQPVDLPKLMTDGTVSPAAAEAILGAEQWATLKADSKPSADAKNSDSGSKCKTCNGSGKIKGGNVNCPDCNCKTEDADETKGMTCGKCGASCGDSKFCPDCGKKVRKADKAAKADGELAEELVLDLSSQVIKAVAGGQITQSAGDALIAEIIAKAAPTRGLPGDTKPAGSHREPDGTTSVERLEQQAGMHTDADSTPDKVPVSVQGLGDGMTAHGKSEDIPYSVGRMHDALCAAYSAEALTEAYPALKGLGDAIDADWFAGLAKSAVDASQWGDAQALCDVAAQAAALKADDAAALADGRASLHKAFTDMYPNERCSPGAPPAPGSYHRPYLSAGHASESASGNGSPNIPPSTHTPEPEQFHRPLITDGHQSDSPANKTDNNPVSPVTDSSRAAYTIAQRDQARVRMQNIHDHIQARFSNLCPMAATKNVMPADMGAGNSPAPAAVASQGGVMSVGKSAEDQVRQLIADAVARHEAPGKLTRKQLAKAAAAKGYTLTPAAEPDVDRQDLAAAGGAMPVGLTADQLKALLTEQITPLTEQMTTQITELRKEVDSLSARPDPALAPVRGALARAENGFGAPVERRSLADEAATKSTASQMAADEANYRGYVELLAKSPDPKVREKAHAVLNKLSAASAA